MEPPVNVAMTLKSSARQPAMVAKVQEIAAKLGFQTMSTGRAAISFRIDEVKFKDIFGVAVRRISPQSANGADFGRSGGHVVDIRLEVPRELKPYVETVGVVPPARRF